MGPLIGTAMAATALAAVLLTAWPSRSHASETDPAITTAPDTFDLYTDAPQTNECCGCHLQECVGR